MSPIKPFITKLGTAKRVERSRIWIEGKRLAESGFVVGAYFHKHWDLHDTFDVIVRLRLVLAKPDDVCTEMPCKVSGKGEKPIIDITGQQVRDAFGFDENTHVQCEFKKGLIKITGTQ